MTGPQVTTLPDGKISDFVDQKIRNDTPEEYVRQNIERRLVLELGYPPDQIEVEFPLKLGSSRVRADLAVFPAGVGHTQDHALILIECKRDSVEPSAKKDGVEQLKSYLSACPNAEWGLWTNGKRKSVLRKVTEGGQIVWSEPNDLPGSDGDVEELDRPKREDLRLATGDNLLFSFRICHDQAKMNRIGDLVLVAAKLRDEAWVPGYSRSGTSRLLARRLQGRTIYRCKQRHRRRCAS